MNGRWLCSGWGQLMVMSYLYFANIGMYNALNTIGGLGTGDENISHACNTTLYGTGLVGGFFAGSAVNYFGQRVAAFIGSCAQTLMILTVYVVHYYGVPGQTYYIAGASVVGGLFIGWMLASVASGIVHYPTERQRSTFVAVASAILNVGGVIGGALSLGMNFDADSSSDAVGGLSNASYLALLIVCSTALVVSFFIQPPEKITRSDGTHPEIPHVEVKDEFRGIVNGLKEPYLWLMVPLFMCSIWHEVTLFNFFNVELFNVRSRAMNTIYYYVGRVLVSFSFQYACDMCRGLKKRILAATIFTMGLCAIGFTCALLALTDFQQVRTKDPVDFTEGRSWFLALAFLIYGGLETTATSFSFWLIGVLPFNDAAMVNRYVGWYRVASSFGGFLSWMIDTTGKVSNLVQWIISACLWVIAILLIFLLRHMVPDLHPGEQQDEQPRREKSLLPSGAEEDGCILEI